MRRAINLLLALALLVGSLVTGLPAAVAQSDGNTALTPTRGFVDIDGHWARSFIMSLQLARVLDVPEDGKFSPEEKITRLDFTYYVAKAMELDPVEPAPGAEGGPEAPFKDWDQIPEGRRGLVAAAVNAEIIKGYPDGTFRPANPITRAELALIFGRALIRLGEEPSDRHFYMFADMEAIPDWASDSSAAVKAGIVKGRAGRSGWKPYYAPHENTTRAEAATMIYRFVQVRFDLLGIEMPKPDRELLPARLNTAYYVREEQAMASLERYGEDLDLVFYAGYQIGTDGTLWGTDSVRLAEWAQETNTPVLVMLGNHDRAENSKILNDLQVQQAAVERLLQLMQKGYAGVNIDFEMVAPEDREAYTRFVTMVASALRPRGYLVTVALPARNAATANSSWGRSYDYEAIGAVVDYAVIMTYDQHYNGGPYGPIGGLDWMTEIMKYATSTIPSKKLLLGIPSYGRSWPLNGGSGVAIRATRAEELIRTKGVTPTYDPQTAEVSFRYTDDNGVARIAYYTDARGLEAKLGLVREMNLGGMAMWRLGYETPDYWPVMRKMLR